MTVRRGGNIREGAEGGKGVEEVQYTGRVAEVLSNKPPEMYTSGSSQLAGAVSIKLPNSCGFCSFSSFITS